MKGIFLDRDGTIIIDKHYLHKVEDIEFLEGAIEALQLFDSMGYKLFIVTNQSGVGRGYFPYENIGKVHLAMEETMNKHNLPKFEGIEICPHAPDENCECRKPSPLMINRLMKKYDIDPNQSYMVGDKVSDVEAGKNANLKDSFLITKDFSLLDIALKIKKDEISRL